MALNIKGTETEKLAAEIAEMTGDTKTGAVREALREKKRRLELQANRGTKEKPRSMQEWLETEVWPLIPEEERTHWRWALRLFVGNDFARTDIAPA